MSWTHTSKERWSDNAYIYKYQCGYRSRQKKVFIGQKSLLTDRKTRLFSLFFYFIFDYLELEYRLDDVVIDDEDDSELE